MTKRLICSAASFLLIGAVAWAGSITGTVQCSGARDNANALVYIERIDGETFQPPADPVVMDQKGKLFLPYVLPVLVGTKVEFLNSDSFKHNVFTPDKCAGKFNLGSWPQGETRSHTFNEPCEAVVLCSLHPEMVGYVIAVETPYFAVTDADGSFTIPDVPEGTYTLTTWHERLKPQEKQVTVEGDSTRVDFTLKR